MSEQAAAGKALRLWVHRPVLRIDQKPVVSRAAQLLSDGGRATVEEEAHLRLTSLQLGLEDLPTLIGDRHSVVVDVFVRRLCREECRCLFPISTFPARRVYSVPSHNNKRHGAACETPPPPLTILGVDDEEPVWNDAKGYSTSSRGLA